MQSYQQEIVALKAQLQQNSLALSLSPSPLDEIQAKKSKAESDVASLQLQRIRLQEQIEHLNRRILTRNTIESNVRRSSLSMSQPPDLDSLENIPHPARRRRGRLTDFGGLVGLGHGHGMFSVGLRASTGPRLSASVSSRGLMKEQDWEKEVERLQQALEEAKSKPRDTSFSQEQEAELLARVELAETEAANALQAAKQSHEDMLETMKQQIVKLEEEKSNLTQLHVEGSEKLIDETKLKDDRILELEQQLAETNERATQLLNPSQSDQTTISLLKDEIEQLKQANAVLQEGARTIASLEDQSAQELASVHEAEEASKVALRERIRELEERNQTLDVERANALEVVPHTTSERLCQLEAQLVASENVKAEIEAQKQQDILQLQEELANANKAKEDLESAKDAELSRLQADLSSVQTTILKVTAEKDSIKTEASERETTSMTRHNDHTLQLENQINELKSTLDATRIATEESKTELLAKITQLDEELKTHLATKSEAEAIQAKLARLDSKVSNERNRVHELQLELMQMTQSRDEFENHALALENELADLHVAQESTDQTERKMMAETKRLEEELESAKKEIDSYRIKYDELTQKCASYEDELRIARGKSDEITMSLKMKEKTFKDTENAAKVQKSELERTISRLERELKQVKEEAQHARTKAEEKMQLQNHQAQSDLQRTHQAEVEKIRVNNSNLVEQVFRLEKDLEKQVGQQQTTAESMEAIVELNTTIAEQKKVITELREELKRSMSQASSQRLSTRHEHAHQGAEDEIERLHSIIDEQKKMLSDAKTDMTKWQAVSETLTILKAEKIQWSVRGRC